MSENGNTELVGKVKDCAVAVFVSFVVSDSDATVEGVTADAGESGGRATGTKCGEDG